MALTEKYLNQLIADKTALANNLTTKGVEASVDETFTELVPKVLDIPSGGNEITKGLIVKACDENGYVTDVEIVGLTSLPTKYFGQYSDSYFNGFYKIVNVKLPDDLTSLGKRAFDYCQYLTSVNIPRGITEIGEGTFRFCYKLVLTESKMPDGITTIGNYAFYNCHKITSMDFSDKLTSIGVNAISSGNLATLIIRATTPPSLGNASFSTKTNIYVPDESVEAYQTATNWSSHAAQIKGLSELPTE